MAKKLFIGSLPYSATSEDLEKLFSEVGEVLSATVIVDRMTNRSKGFGFVEYKSDEHAEEAIKRFNGYDLDGRQIVVNEAKPREDNDNRNSFNSRR
jgi:cold-inducible RNA-binding protein